LRNFLSKKARNITPYVAGEQPRGRDIIKLNTNESPYPPSPRVYDAIKSELGSELRKYPDPCGGEFRMQAAEYVGLKEENIFCGNGSDEVLGFAFQAFFDEDRRIKVPDISYSFYPVWSQLFDIQTEIMPVNENFEIDVEDYYNSQGGVVIANPNAPTGIALKIEKIEKVVKNNLNCVVIIDEAYVEFGGDSAVPLVRMYDNLLVIRTLSKSQSLAGIRAGFAVGHPKLIDGLFRIKDSFNSYPVNSLTSAAAAAALKDKEYYNGVSKKVIETREWTAMELEKLGYEVLPSKTNFIFAKPKVKNAKEVFDALKENDIIVRWFDKDRIRDYLRITIGTDDDMKTLVECLTEINDSK